MSYNVAEILKKKDALLFSKKLDRACIYKHGCYVTFSLSQGIHNANHVRYYSSLREVLEEWKRLGAKYATLYDAYHDRVIKRVRL